MWIHSFWSNRGLHLIILLCLSWLLKYNTRSSYRPSPLSESADLDKLSKFPLISASNNSALFVPPCLFQSWESERGKFGHSSPRDASSLFPQARTFPGFHPHFLMVLRRSPGRRKRCTRKMKHSGERVITRCSYWGSMVRAVGWLVGGCPKLIDVLLFFPFQPRSLYLTTTLDCGKKEEARPLFLSTLSVFPHLSPHSPDLVVKTY